LRAYQWVRNSVYDASLQKAIDNTAGTGKNTIMEFSLGINDKNAYSRAGTKTNILDCLNAYLNAKPDAHVFLVVPVTHQTSFQEEWPVLYSEIAQELNLPLINKERVMYDAFYDGDDRFYYDNTHPNYFGALRLIRYILESVSGSIAKNKMQWDEKFFTGSENGGSENLATGKSIITNSWYWPHNKSPELPGGSVQYNGVLRRLEPFDVNANSLIRISGVNVHSASMMNSNGKLIYTFSASEWKNHNIQYFYVPCGASEVRITLNAAADEGSGEELVVVEYLCVGALTELTAKDIYYKWNQPSNGLILTLSDNRK
jgi:hypothetical protein